MMSFLKHKGLLYVAVVAALSAGCTKVDDTLGNELIPENQQMSADVIVLGADKTEPAYFKTFLMQKDSFPSSYQGFVTIGARYDQTFGYSTASAIIQPVPYLAHSDESYYGYEPVIDSVYLNLYISLFAGKPDVEQTFNIYRVTKDIKRDSTYYLSYPGWEVSDMGAKLFSFKHSGKTVNLHALKLEIHEPAGKEYLDELVAADLSIENDSLFLEKFKGLYIVPEDKQADAAQYRTLLDCDTYYTNLAVFFHNFEKDSNPRIVADTACMLYKFSDFSTSSYYTYNVSTSITSLERNYPASLTALLGSDTEVDVAYVEAMDGVYTELRMQPELLAKLQSLCPAGKKMAVNKAMIYFELKPGYTPAVLNTSIGRLGMFYNYAKLSPIPDYDYAYDYKQSQTGGYIPYGGYLNRSTGNYAMNITQTIQKMVSTGAYTERISLTPDCTEILGLYNTTLRGSAEAGYKIKLKITYSLIEP